MIIINLDYRSKPGIIPTLKLQDVGMYISLSTLSLNNKTTHKSQPKGHKQLINKVIKVYVYMSLVPGMTDLQMSGGREITGAFGTQHFP